MSIAICMTSSHHKAGIAGNQFSIYFYSILNESIMHVGTAKMRNTCHMLEHLLRKQQCAIKFVVKFFFIKNQRESTVCLSGLKISTIASNQRCECFHFNGQHAPSFISPYPQSQ